MQYSWNMKTSSLPCVRVEPELRASVESVLNANESISEFVENSVRQAVTLRRAQSEFLARGITSLDNARRTGGYVGSGTLLEKMTYQLGLAKKQMQAPNL